MELEASGFFFATRFKFLSPTPDRSGKGNQFAPQMAGGAIPDADQTSFSHFRANQNFRISIFAGTKCRLRKSKSMTPDPSELGGVRKMVY
jgi:hypothetical protein